MPMVNMIDLRDMLEAYNAPEALVTAVPRWVLAILKAANMLMCDNE